jgi:hypothetical protein
MGDIERCPTCGCPVTVVGGDEGTSHYEPRPEYGPDGRWADLRHQLAGAVVPNEADRRALHSLIEWAEARGYSAIRARHLLDRLGGQ